MTGFFHHDSFATNVFNCCHADPATAGGASLRCRRKRPFAEFTLSVVEGLRVTILPALFATVLLHAEDVVNEPPGIAPPTASTDSIKTDSKPQVISGWKTLQFDELPVPKIKPRWFSYKFDVKKEKFLIYVPKTYRANQPCGVLGWINPEDDLEAPKKFESLFDEFRLIVVTAEGCGNTQWMERRVGLLVSAAMELSETMAIDPKRRILSGVSGGGRAAALGGFVHPEFWSGVISWCGGNYYKDYPVAGHPELVHHGINHSSANAVTSDNVTGARKAVRFVLLTGAQDFNLDESRDLETALKNDGISALLIEETGLGHAVGSEKNMRKAIEFILSNR